MRKTLETQTQTLPYMFNLLFSSLLRIIIVIVWLAGSRGAEVSYMDVYFDENSWKMPGRIRKKGEEFFSSVIHRI